jgi:hypothetical protein
MLTEIGHLEIELFPSLQERALKQVRPHRTPPEEGFMGQGSALSYSPTNGGRTTKRR